MTRESANNLKVDRNSTTHFKTSHTSPEGAKSLAQGSALGGNLNSSDIKCVGFTNPARVDTTVGDLIEAIADIASAAGKTEMQGLEMAREVLQKILAEKQKKMIIKDCE